MRIQYYLYSFIALGVGFCGGLWFGLQHIYIEVEEIPTKTIFDVITLISSILATVCVFVTTFLAIYLFRKWRYQQHESNLMQLRNNIIADSISLNRVFNGFLVRYYMYEQEQKVDELVAEVSNSNLELISKLTLYYSLISADSLGSDLQIHLMKKHNDGFNVLKDVLEVVRVTMGSQHLKLLESKPGRLKYRKLEAEFVGKDFYEIVGELFNSEGEVETSKLQIKVCSLTNTAIVDISNLNRNE